MIYDKIDNLETYAAISEDIRKGLEWLRDVSPDIEKGVYKLSPRVKALVSEYTTKDINDNGYEAHREFIDIQFLIKGSERVFFLPVEQLKEVKAYRNEIDAAFYEEYNTGPQILILGKGYFSIFFPQDGHMPCIKDAEAGPVKKVVVKIRL